MLNLKSLYLRMTIVHYIGIILLPINAFLFTTNIISQSIQIIISITLIIHELDERKNGNNLSKELVKFLKNMDNKNVSLEVNTSMSSEYAQIKDVIDKREQFSNINDILYQYTNYNYTNKLKLKGISQDGELNLLVGAINQLKEAISQMLLENKQNGVSLQNSSEVLLDNVDKLNTSSKEAAKSLENTSSVLGTITQNVSKTSEQQ